MAPSLLWKTCKSCGEASSPKVADGGVMQSMIVRIAGVLSAVGAPMLAWAQERQYDYGWGHPMWGMWGAWGIGMMLMWILFWVLLIVALVLGVRWLMTQGKEPRSDSALEILRQRYARGEINKEQFEAMKRDLT